MHLDAADLAACQPVRKDEIVALFGQGAPPLCCDLFWRETVDLIYVHPAQFVHRQNPLETRHDTLAFTNAPLSGSMSSMIAS